MTGKAWEILSYVITAVLYILVKRTLYKQVQLSLYTFSSDTGSSDVCVGLLRVQLLFMIL